MRSVVLAVVGLGLVGACGGGGQGSSTTSAAATGSLARSAAPKTAATGSAAPGKPAPAADLDSLVVEAVQKGMACDVLEKPWDCSALADGVKLITTAASDKARAAAILETFGVLATDADEKKANTARYFISKMDSLYVLVTLSKANVAVSEATGQRYIQALSATKNKLAASLASPVAHVAGMAGLVDPVLEAAKAHPDADVYPNVLKNVMRYARMKAFDAVKAAGASETEAIKASALAAPLEMPSWTDEEKAALCPWAKPFLADPSLDVAGNAAHMMVRCKLAEDGAYIDAMLAEGKTRVGKGEWQKPFVWAFRDVCFGGFLGDEKKPSTDICQKTYDFLEWVANQEKVEPWFRGFALSMIYYQRRDRVTYDLLKKYKNSKVEEIRKAVEEDMKSLEENYLKDK